MTRLVSSPSRPRPFSGVGCMVSRPGELVGQGPGGRMGQCCAPERVRSINSGRNSQRTTKYGIEDWRQDHREQNGLHLHSSGADHAIDSYGRAWRCGFLPGLWSTTVLPA